MSHPIIDSHRPNPKNTAKSMSFASLKKQSSLGNLTAKLVKEVEKSNSLKVETIVSGNLR